MEHQHANGTKHRNFRFSDDDVKRIDDLVAWFSTNRDTLLFFERATRTDVLRYLVREKLRQVDDIERQKAEKLAEEKIARTFRKPRTKKAKS